MFSKVLSSISMLLLVAVTIIPFSKAQAQGLVEYALILVVVGFNKNEGVELYWRTNPASSAAAINDFEDPPTYLWIYQSGTSDCKQRVQLPRPDYQVPGINVLALEYSDGVLLISGTGYGEPVERPLNDECFDGRVVAQLGVPIPPGQEDRIFRELASNPSAPVAGMPRIEGFSIYDAETKDTKTQSSKLSGESVRVAVLDSGID
jgi:hypothetical protein